MTAYLTYLATTSYNGSDSEKCLSLVKGDTVSAVHMLDEDWYIGRNDRTQETGAFPRTCVTPYSVSADSSPVTGLMTVSGTQEDTPVYAHVSKQNMADKAHTEDSCRQTRFNVDHSISVPHSDTSWQELSLSTTTSHKGDHVTGDNHVTGSKRQRLKKFGGSIMSSTENLIQSERGERRRIKAVLGIIFGVLIGIVLFLLSVYSFGYTYIEASILMTLFTILMSVGLAMSTHCRCIMTLVFPGFLTGRGRTILMSILFSLMLAHPISNIIHNVKETGHSMACIVDIAANQSRILQKQLAVPLVQLAEYIDSQQSDLRAVGDEIQGSFSDVRTALDDADKGINDAKSSIDAVRKNCIDRVDGIKRECNNRCPSVLCGSTCDVMDGIRTTCEGFTVTDTAITQAAANARAAIDEAVNYFNVDIQITGDFNASTNTSRSLTDMQAEVNDDIGEKAESVSAFVKLLSKGLSLTILLLFLQSFWYLRNYLAKDAYDNIYITSKFKHLDENMKRHGREKTLPLKKNEEEIYVDTASYKLASCELSHCKIGFIIVGLHMVLFILVLVFDISLWYILDLVAGYGNVDLEVKGEGRVTVKVDGQGPVADFYRVMIRGLNIDENYTANVDIGECLPQPKEPEFGIYPVYLILYLVTFAFVILQGYGMRLRRKICAYYYPEQETARLHYLHKKIKHKRVGFLKFLRQQIMSSHKEEQVKDQLRLSTWLAFKCPCIATFLPKKTTLECTSCEEREGSFNHIKVSRCSGKTGGIQCDAAYCDQCWKALLHVCPLCQTDDVQLRD